MTLMDVFKPPFLILFQEAGDTVITNQVAMCKSTYKLYFLGVVYTMKGLLLLFGTFLAWGTRKVNALKSHVCMNDCNFVSLIVLPPSTDYFALINFLW